MDNPNLAAADFLFALLDDIDTASDMAKGDDKAYRAMVERIQRRRFEVASTDGNSVTFHARPSAAEATLRRALEHIADGEWGEDINAIQRRAREALTDMKCVICKKGRAEGVSLFRINATGVPGLWACAKHRDRTDAPPVDPEVEKLVSIIERGK